MIAAIYTRKSTSQEKGASGDSLSVERQVELSRAFAQSKGWEVLEPPFKDDGISGALFGRDKKGRDRRPGLAALMVALDRKPRPFDIVICMDNSRLGRDQYRTAYVLQQIADAGVTIWYYQENRQAQLDDATGKFMESVKGYASEMEREKGRARTTEGKLKQVRAGRFPGGPPPLGYKRAGDGLAIDETQAPRIRHLFQSIADGAGIRRAGQLIGVAATTARHMIASTTYRGELVYNGAAERVVLTVPAIIERDLWDQAHSRMAITRETFTGHRKETGELVGRPVGSHRGPHLLSGLLRCGYCGSSLVVVARGTQRIRRYFACSARYKLGRPCDFKHLLPYAKITDAILEPFSARHENVLHELFNKGWQEYEQDRLAAYVGADQLRNDAARLTRELDNLIGLAAAGGQSVPEILAAIQAKRAARDAASARLADARAPHPIYTAGAQPTTADAYAIWADWLNTPDGQEQMRQWEAISDEFLGSLRETLERRGEEGHRMLKTMLPGRITVSLTYENDVFTGWRYGGDAQLGDLVGGFIAARRERVTGTRPATRLHSVVTRSRFRVALAGRIKKHHPFGPGYRIGSGLYLMRFPDHYKVGLSDRLLGRIAQHRHDGAELICWVEVPSDHVDATESGLILQVHHFLRDGLELSERFQLTDAQVAKVQHRMMRWERACKRGRRWTSAFFLTKQLTDQSA